MRSLWAKLSLKRWATEFHCGQGAGSNQLLTGPLWSLCVCDGFERHPQQALTPPTVTNITALYTLRVCACLQQRALAQSKHQLLPDNHPASMRVRRLGMAIAAVAADGAGGGRYSHMKDLQWEFAVIMNPTPNAFVVPGGKVR